MIYAIHAVGTEFLKFGVTRNMERRLAAHQVSCPFELAILATAPWPDAAECRIHNLLRRHSVRGEWFKACDLAYQIIELMLSDSSVEVLNSLQPATSGITSKRLGNVITYARVKSVDSGT